MFGRIDKIVYDRGFGFIHGDDRTTRVFFHAREVQNRPFKELLVGERVEFDITEMDDGRFRAVNVEVQ